MMEERSEDLSGSKRAFSTYSGTWNDPKPDEVEPEPEADAMMVYAGLGIAGGVLILFLVVVLLCYVCKKK